MTEPSREPSPWPGPAYPATPPSGAAWPAAPQRSAPTALAVASGVLAIVLALLAVVIAIASGPASKEFADAARAGYSTYDVFTSYDGLALLLFPFLIGAYVVSCLWLQFARANTMAIAPRVPHQRGRVWVWLGWWVPIVSLWFPFQVVRDVQDASRPEGRTVGLGLWWAAWLVYLFGSRVAASASTSTDPGFIEALPTIEWINAGALAVACVQWCRILYVTTTNQQRALASAAAR
ncbi:DUF4328 domain-containing protein [Nocardioides sp. CPCC 206347]|uniref:DUF4328 domain-containing protein n=1 Tax=Nocardioides sp. CPCC 206347 TaxID=3406463 RepID=UPI003B42AC1B